MSVPCECYVLSGKGLCVGLIAHPEESYQVWVCLSVIVKSQGHGGPDLLQIIKSQKKTGGANENLLVFPLSKQSLSNFTSIHGS
jgi:hypothetical protein